MATNERIERCKYCGHPSHCTGPVGTKNRFHNNGCPIGDTSIINPEAAMAEWKRGYSYGFDDNYINPYDYRFYSATYTLGYEHGKAEINRLVERAAQRYCSLDE